GQGKIHCARLRAHLLVDAPEALDQRLAQQRVQPLVEVVLEGVVVQQGIVAVQDEDYWLVEGFAIATLLQFLGQPGWATELQAPPDSMLASARLIQRLAAGGRRGAAAWRRERRAWRR